MSESAILAAARAATVAHLSGVTDKSDRPEDLLEKDLPAFIASLERLGAERTAMGAATFDATLELTVEIFREVTPGADPRAVMQAEAEGLAVHLAGAPTIAALVDDAIPTTIENDLDRGRGKLVRGTVKLQIMAEV